MKTILVTGANRGIGLEFVKQYLNADWHVIACCRDPQNAKELNELAKQHQNQLLIKKLDLNEMDDVPRLSSELANESIDILLNNAGIFNNARGFEDILPSDWMSSLQVNTIMPALLAQALLKQVAQSELKIIANMNSGMGSIAENTSGGYCIYRTSKAALNSITKCLSIDLSEYKIIVISLNPGWVRTDMGGESATLTPEESVRGMRTQLEKLTLKDSGSFISHNGKKVAW